MMVCSKKYVRTTNVQKGMLEQPMFEQPMFEKSRSQPFQIVLENDGLFEKICSKGFVQTGYC